MAERCRLCTANDDQDLLERLAADLWESRRDGTLELPGWAEAGDHWQMTFRTFARAAALSLGRELHVHSPAHHQ